MQERKQRVNPTPEQEREALALQKAIEDTKAAWDAALLKRNIAFYKWGTVDDPGLSASALGRLLKVSANQVNRLFNGGNLTNEQRDAAAKDAANDSQNVH